MSQPHDNTVLDDPITPAPIFAYRAFRGILFGSPGSPESFTADSNKENVPVGRNTVKASDKPEKSDRLGKGKAKAKEEPKSHNKTRSRGRSDTLTIAQTGSQDEKNWNAKFLAVPPSPTFTSPSKGILRTPGQLTPRARSLKDICVTFKGISPDAAIAVRTSKSLGDFPSPATSRAAPSARVNAQPVAQPAVGPAPQAQPSFKVKDPMPDVAATHIPKSWQDYVKKTEKEMKKIIRRSQQFKDAAYRADLENQELRAMIKKLQHENKRLRSSKQAIVDDVLFATDAISGPEYDQYGAPIPVRNPRPWTIFGDDLTSREPPNQGSLYVRNEVNRVDTAVRNQARRQQTQPTQHGQTVPGPKYVKKSSAIDTYYANNAAMLASKELDPKGPPISVDQVLKTMASRPPMDLEAMLDEAVRIVESPTDSPLKRKLSHPKVYASNKIRARLAAEDAKKADTDTEPGDTAAAAATTTTSTSAPARPSPPTTTGMAPERSAAARERLRQKAEVRKASLEFDVVGTA